jgi:uncharacterized membrane protein YkoI
MSRTRSWCIAMSVAALGVAGADAQDASAKLKGLPPAVQKAVAIETRGATIKGVAKEVEAGNTVYEVETLVNGRTRDLLFASDGALLVVEEQASLDTIPAAARAAIEKRAAGGRITTVELVTRGSAVAYEAVVVKGGKKSEVTVNADGSPTK